MIFVCNYSLGQTKISNKGIETDVVFRFQLFKPNQFGNYSLAKSHEAKLGWGLSLSFLKYDKFRATAGLDYIQYEIKDNAKLGNFNYSNYLSLYFNVGYELNLMDNLMLTPNIGYGKVGIYLKTSAQDFGTQSGNEYRIGLITDYDLNESFSVFVNATFIKSSLNINTAPEYIDYFGNAKQFQIGVGLKIH